MWSFKLILTSAFLLLLSTGIRAQHLEIREEPCDKDRPNLKCGELTVPQNWEEPSKGKIVLPVKLFKSTATSPLGAVFWLSGGPGQTNVGYVPPAQLITAYDVVAVGFRGVDGQIKLNCKEIQKALKGVGNDLLSTESQERLREAARECADRLETSGIDLNGFTIEHVISDLEAARKALGYDKINLLAGSYGTRVSQIYMQQYPEVIERAVLIGTGVPGGLVWTEEVISEQLEELNSLCQADPYCSQKTSDLTKTIDEVLKNAPRRWALVGIDVGKVRATTFGLLYHRETARQVVDAYLAAADGDYSGIALMSLAYNFTVPKMMVWGDFLSKGLIDYDSTVYYFDEMDGEKKTSLGSPFSALFMDMGKNWPTRQPRFDESKVIETPVLLLNGSLDFSTPTTQIERYLMPRLPNGHLVRFEGLGHVNDILYRKEVKQSITEFYQGSFTGLNPEPVVFDFKVSNGFPEIAKISLAIAIVLSVGIVFGSYKLVRRWTR